MIEAYLTVLVGVAAGQIAPGPNLVAVASMGMSQGRTKAMMTALGIATAILAWIVAAAMGIAVFIVIYPYSLTVMRFLGGGYLALVAIRSASAAIRGGGGASFCTVTDRPSLATAWRHGLLVNLTNPKSALLWTAVATYLFGAGLTTSQVIGFGPIGALCACTVYGTYAVLFSTDVAMRSYRRCARAFEAVFAATFGALGTGLIWSGIREVRG